MTQTFSDTKSILTDSEHRMQKAVDATKNELQAIRTGRANAALVEGIQVDYYGSKMALKGIAAITIPDAKTIVIQAWDHGAVPAIEKAIQESGLGLTPHRDGHVIRLPIPTLTDERRQELDKVVRKSAEEGRISIRNIRHEANEGTKKLEKAKTIGEDISKMTQKKIQDLTDKYIKFIDELLAKKEQELVG
ncbi:MAG: ribosome recycling factor [Omnitrophica bacterium RIFCSPLOWO2_12_FULL_44_17]|uniref:Ribosome-recycling factor n=1 Tax=Candidatus Danuiimicrobium aquiferis TaxID=1801832 RepID=A0A1G1KRP9_9BACT|nr:MAG: ribosome recycling factor [Omnitrophica bacterium RIFCSPHIGHO2_12_FULL_44_12]OGW95495.1 MAG: ribosome recycling factor [Omnitrophica bacterium RIFCSPLOWO2_12_FULL_44_17]OGX01858.1 MAG: ribosome recycling factor [Omnitrophica bacterium RIFCSPLOWO2_02_FULL_44_11]